MDLEKMIQKVMIKANNLVKDGVEKRKVPIENIVYISSVSIYKTNQREPGDYYSIMCRGYIDGHFVDLSTLYVLEYNLEDTSTFHLSPNEFFDLIPSPIVDEETRFTIKDEYNDLELSLCGRNGAYFVGDKCTDNVYTTSMNGFYMKAMANIGNIDKFIDLQILKKAVLEKNVEIKELEKYLRKVKQEKDEMDRKFDLEFPMF